LEPVTAINELITIETDIRRLEEKVGIKNEEDRVIEAALLIDSKFLNTAVITENYESIERFFGDEVWMGWLKARLEEQEHGTQELSEEFINKLHTALTHQSRGSTPGQLRNSTAMGQNYLTDKHAPLSFTHAECRSIRQNDFLKLELTSENPPRGYIYYPSLADGALEQTARYALTSKAQQMLTDDPTESGLVRALLFDTVQWYNQVRKTGHYNPYILAAELQRRIISIHPFGDANGRLSRILMNWSLQNDDLDPSILEDPSDDLYLLLEDWVDKVKEGSDRYRFVKERQKKMEKAGVKDIAEMLNLGEERTFYKYIYQHIEPPPLFPTNGQKIDHSLFDKYIANFEREKRAFDSEFSAICRTPNSFSVNRTSLLRQGGLVPQGYINIYEYALTKDINTYIRKRYYSDRLIYRGVECKDTLNAESIVDFFQQPTSIESSYQASRKAKRSTSSNKRIDPSIIQKVLVDYNQVMGNSYLAKHGIIQNPLLSFPNILLTHVQADPGIEDSPYVSTSFIEHIGRDWAGRGENSYGVLCTAFAPKMAGVYGFIDSTDHCIKGIDANLEKLVEAEQELAIPGGVDFRSIQRIEARYCKIKKSPTINPLYGTPDIERVLETHYIAERKIQDGKEVIIVHDYTQPITPIEKVYELDSITHRYKLVDQQNQNSNV